MPKPVTPVLNKIGEGPQVTFAKNQPQYSSLPTLCTENAVMSRWHLAACEIRQLLDGSADLYLIQMNHGQSLQPIRLLISASEDEALSALMSTTPNQVVKLCTACDVTGDPSKPLEHESDCIMRESTASIASLGKLNQ